MSPSLSVILALLLVLLNGFFVAAEFAMVKVRSTRIEELAQQGRVQARVARRALRNITAYLSATQIGITVASLGLGAVGEPAFARLLLPLFTSLGALSKAAAHATAVAIALGVITFLQVVFGELVPKRVAIQRPEGTVLWVSLPLNFFFWLFYPAIGLLNWTATAVLGRLGLGATSEPNLGHSEEEIRMILTGSYESGYLKDRPVASRSMRSVARRNPTSAPSSSRIAWMISGQDCTRTNGRCPSERL